MVREFDRKIFTFISLHKDLGFLLYKSPKIIGALRNEKISKAFMEKIMTIVTAVNGCSYCSWFHAKQAIASGISEEEVKNMMKLQFEADTTDFEITGLLYAQHYAETNRNPDQAMTDTLFEYYGKKTANHIILFIRMILFGNLYGNTFDAFLSRLKGNKAKNSNIVFETIFFLINALIFLPILSVTQKHQNQE